MEKKPCKYILNGQHCPYGKNCRFSHNINQKMKSNNFLNTNNNSENQQNNNSNYCFNFLDGNCIRDKCPNFHGYCTKLQHFKTIEDHKNLIKELFSVNNTSYISVDNNEFFVRNLENSNGNLEFSQNIPKGSIFKKVIYSGKTIICAVEKNSK